MNPLIEQIRLIKTGTAAEVKAAQKLVEKYWHRSCQERELRRDFEAFKAEAADFDAITDRDHKAYFINTLKWVIWGMGLENFKFWENFLIKCVLDQDGKIRMAAIRAAEYLLIEIDDYLEKGSYVPADFSEEKARVARALYAQLLIRVGKLIDAHYEPRFRRCKYLDSLPVGIYKSLQQFYDALVPSEHYERVAQRSIAENTPPTPSFPPIFGRA